MKTFKNSQDPQKRFWIIIFIIVPIVIAIISILPSFLSKKKESDNSDTSFKTNIEKGGISIKSNSPGVFIIDNTTGISGNKKIKIDNRNSDKPVVMIRDDTLIGSDVDIDITIEDKNELKRKPSNIDEK